MKQAKVVAKAFVDELLQLTDHDLHSVLITHEGALGERYRWVLTVTTTNAEGGTLKSNTLPLTEWQ